VGRAHPIHERLFSVNKNLSSPEHFLCSAVFIVALLAVILAPAWDWLS
jgi:hypothetical protein